MSRVLGHDLVEQYPVPLGWRTVCECGQMFTAPRLGTAQRYWREHTDTEAENRAYKPVKMLGGYLPMTEEFMHDHGIEHPNCTWSHRA